MPWRGAEHDRDFPTLGWELLEWWADYLPSPNNPDKELMFTDEQALLLLDWYAIDPISGRFPHRRGASRRSKGWGKSPVEAAKAIAELAGPVRFGGWDANGEPVGVPWGVSGETSAWVQIAAVSEDQTDNTYSSVYDFLTANDAKAADALRIDPGLTRCYLRDGQHTGKLEPVTAAAGSREGQRVTYGVLDETHLWLPRNGGVRLARTLRRNVAKMGGRTYETTNSFEPGEGSVAEGTHNAVVKGSEGIFYDAVEAPTLDIDQATDDEIREALAVAYGDSRVRTDASGKQAGWVDLERLVADIRDPDTTPEDAARFYFNWNVKGGGKAVDPKVWAQLANKSRIVEPGERIGLGFDGSISDDATAIMGCTEDGFHFQIAVWERPLGVRDWRVPRLAVHEKIAETFQRYQVGRMFGDPPRWETEMDQWAEIYGEDVVLRLETYSERRFAPAVTRWRTDIAEGKYSYDGSDALTRHVLAATLKKARARDLDDDGRTAYVITKGQDTRKVDAAVADVLANEAAATMPVQDAPGELIYFS